MAYQYQIGDIAGIGDDDAMANSMEGAYTLAADLCAQSDELFVGVWELADGDADLVAIVHQGEVYTR